MTKPNSPREQRLYERGLAAVNIEPRRGWRHEAACLGLDPNLFFPEVGNNSGVARARQTCTPCPVQLECLQAGLGRQHGIWGGTTDRDRRVIRRLLNIILEE